MTPHDEDIPPLTDDPESGGFSLGQVWQYVTFIRDAVWRHRMVSGIVFLVVTACAGAVIWAWPRTYRVEAKLLARRNDLMTSLSNPGRPARPEADDPTRAAYEIVHHRDNLLALMRETRVVDRWDRIRSPLGHLRRSLQEWLPNQPDEDRQEALLGMLDQRLAVTVEKEGVVKIGIDWPDAETAHSLVNAAVEHFIATRHDQESAAINEAIGILQGSVASLQADVDRTIAQLGEEEAKRPPLRVRPRASASQSVPIAPVAENVTVKPPAAGGSQETPGYSADLARLGRLQEALETKRQEVGRLETQQRQRVAEVEARLASALTIYTNDHPTVTGLRQSLASMSQDPVELVQARTEVTAMQREVNEIADIAAAARPAAEPVAPQTPASAATIKTQNSDAPGALLAVLPADAAKLTDLAHPSSRLLTLQLAQLANLLDRINAARLELATSSAGLKFRYTVTHPAEFPKRPIKPNVPIAFGLAMVMALLMAVATATAIDLLRGIVWEPWQIEIAASIPVLATVSESQLAEVGPTTAAIGGQEVTSIEPTRVPRRFFAIIPDVGQ